jgi:formylglycine-generating enzyme required for sulfatase activity
MKSKTIFALCGVGMTCFLLSAGAQEVSIPDPGLNAAIREALQKPNGPLTESDLLSLTNLSAGLRNISSVEGLESARNLRILDLDNNSITNFTIASVLTNLSILDLFNNHLGSFVLSNASPSITIIDIALNSLVQCSLPDGLTNLDTLFLQGNALANFNLPARLTRLTQLDLSDNSLTSLALRADMSNLRSVDTSFNQLTNLTLQPNLRRLVSLTLDFNPLQTLSLPSGLTNLSEFFARDNQLTNLTFPADMTNLSFVDIADNQLLNLTLPSGLIHLIQIDLGQNKLSSLTLPEGMTNLSTLVLTRNQLTNLVLPSDLFHLTQMDLGQNKLGNLTLPGGMTNLVVLDLQGNQLTSLTLPPDATKLATLFVNGNPLTTLVLSEQLAATNLAATVAFLRSQGVSVLTYPLAIRLIAPHGTEPGAFEFALTGPPGVYAILSSTNLAAWSPLGAVTNTLGSILFSDVTAHLSPQKFYRALAQPPPANMVFIPLNTFTMGSPTNEQDRGINEGPQTTVILSRGFWIGKYEVTQADYLSVVNTNPSPFPDDLSRPVSNVSWPDATNYCAKLTQRELAAGRIPAGSQYRLPTEAEWECAARAGTSTRFSYGEDPGYTNLTGHAWYVLNSGFAPHSVGQKLPNPWGLYDMEGNVVEWCQDWFGTLPGGLQTDPTGPASSVSGRKVVRGGAFDNFEPSSRSASRLLFNASSPPLTDTDLGFRVVLVIGTQ